MVTWQLLSLACDKLDGVTPRSSQGTEPGSVAVVSSRSLIVQGWLLLCATPRAEAWPELAPSRRLQYSSAAVPQCIHLQLHSSTPLGA